MKTLEDLGVSARPASQFELPESEGQQQFLELWNNLEADLHMGDHGRYRLRRYGRFCLEGDSLQPLDGSSIYQELVDNPLNGGVERTFAPLPSEIQTNPFLNALIRADARLLGLDPNQSWAVGVHCVRIVARPAEPGKPTPEGVHRDAEMYTVQHLIERRNVRGGVFSAYDEERRPTFHWLQLHRWDTVFFRGTTWHSATPIESDDYGHRDILLIDFDPLP